MRVLLASLLAGFAICWANTSHATPVICGDQVCWQAGTSVG